MTTRFESADDASARLRAAGYLTGDATALTPRHWGTGDSAADQYGQVLPMVECRNLAQLGEFVHGIV